MTPFSRLSEIMKRIPTTDEELAVLHSNLSDRLARLNDEKIRLSKRILEVCEARALAKYGVRKGSVVECLERKKQGVVVNFIFFHNCERPPWLAVRFSDNPNHYGSPVTSFRLIKP